MARILLVSNRLPITVKVEPDKLSVLRSPGGLATALKGPHERSGSLWIGWPGDVSRLGREQIAALEQQLATMRLVPLYLTASEVSHYYEGFSNGVLWPLFHYLLDRIKLDDRGADWESYRAINQRFADVVAAQYQPGDMIWVHDYQLCLLPAMLRRRLPHAKIGFFLHIPFPSSEVFRILPSRAAILEGLLGADLIGFHTFSYMRNFSTCLLRILGIEADIDRIPVGGREVRLGVFPIGVDAKSFESLANAPEVRAEAETQTRSADGRKLILGIDRLDYTKGMPRRLLAIERFLEREPTWRGRVRYVQVAVPSREKIPAYEVLRQQVHDLVSRINGTYGTATDVPVHYLYRAFQERQIAAFYRSADVMLVTPLRDGMNLVAKEFVASRSDEDGVLILSEFAGAAIELDQALRINPYDMEQTAWAIKKAVTMPREERRIRMRALRERVSREDVHDWAQSFLDALAQTRVRPGVPQRLGAEGYPALLDRVRTFERLVLLLDYDGTLVPFAPTPDEAAPDRALLELLARLSHRPQTEVHIISGRDRHTLERWFSGLSIGLHAEHGLWSRPEPGDDWRMLNEVPAHWKDRVLPTIEQFTRRTPGSLVEHKSASIAWHYRQADPEFGVFQAKELRLHLSEVLSNFPVHILPGDKVIEIKPQGVDKGQIVHRFFSNVSKTILLAIGDDRTDEDIFAALPEGSIAIHVGPNPSRAPYRLDDFREARAFLRMFLHNAEASEMPS
ncbi:MAG: bifunctional alpha,alpha-trehalose-phosphate synthase (UDP-forming)/trehalose-phosphatase [Polyangiaceae bacterium]|nr:bifunctional alpha,alpha-trehalose-phosphate synthase (UDP-forming)/trehalose-phosphatase [Polyangiaceae bacterium]